MASATPASPLLMLGLPKGSLETATLALFAKAGLRLHLPAIGAEIVTPKDDS